MLNIYILAYLIASVVCLLAMSFVVFLQFKEVRRPRDGFSKLRWRLLFLPALIVFSLMLGLPRLFHNLYIPFDGTGQIIRVASGIVMLASFTSLIVSIYTFKERK